MDPSKRCVVLLSGGLDSAVVAAWAKKWFEFVYPVTFAYGSVHNGAEMKAATAVAHALGLQTQRKYLPPMFQNSALIDGRGGNYIPGRNLVFLSIGVAHALAYRASKVLIGACKDDHADFADTRPAFLEAAATMVERGTDGYCSVFAPLATMRKAEVIKLGLELGAPLHLTHTCYKGETPGCGECQSCRVRAAGFAEVGIPDPALALAAASPQQGADQ
jgi:7-cyano-7-deazaguanine synthase